MSTPVRWGGCSWRRWWSPFRWPGCYTGSPGCAADLLGGHHDRGDELGEHLPLVGFIMTGENQQRRDHPDQPAAASRNVGGVVVAERVDECGGQCGDYVGLLGQLGAQRGSGRREPG